MIDFFNNHKKLFFTAFLFFAVLTLFVAVLPAIDNQRNNAVLPNAIPLSEDALAGKQIFISEGCVACHTQQVRNIAMDKVWGSRPSIAADYAGNTRNGIWQNTATLMGTERTGPDLTNIGLRQPGKEWHLLHLYQPRAVVKESVMPAYPWLFEEKDEVKSGDVEISIPDGFQTSGKKIVARKEALQLVAYLQSLQQVALPGSQSTPEFLYETEESITEVGNPEGKKKLNGKLLYATHCQSCHQENGEGLKGAFPPLKGSAITNGDDLELYVSIIMNGYDARPEYAVMAAVGTNANLNADQVTAIINYEKTSWGNSGKEVSVEDVQKILDYLKMN